MNIKHAIEHLKFIQNTCVYEDDIEAIKLAIKELLHHRAYEVCNLCEARRGF